MAVRLFSSFGISKLLASNNISKLNGYGGVISGLQENARHLYANATLGIDGFLKKKEVIHNQMSNITENFKEKVQEYCKDVNKSMIFTEDLKNMVYLSSTKEDVQVVVKMIKKYNQQNKQLRFGNFIFGPVVMRLFFIQNLPDVALECFKSPELTGFFDQLITYQILLDLLYENQRYQDILHTVDEIKNRQVEGQKYPKNVVVLAMAACYKMNTPESLDYALKLWKQIMEFGQLPMRRATTFCAALALNQGQPAGALEILTFCRNQSYTTVRNIKLIALAETGRLEYILPMLKNLLPQDAPSDSKHTFNKDVIERLQTFLTELPNSNIVSEINDLLKELKINGNIVEATLDEQLCSEIQSPPPMTNQDRDPRRSNFDRNSNFRSRTSRQEGRKFNTRPGLYELA